MANKKEQGHYGCCSLDSQNDHVYHYEFPLAQPNTELHVIPRRPRHWFRDMAMWMQLLHHPSIYLNYCSSRYLFLYFPTFNHQSKWLWMKLDFPGCFKDYRISWAAMKKWVLTYQRPNPLFLNKGHLYTSINHFEKLSQREIEEWNNIFSPINQEEVNISLKETLWK